MNEFVAIFIQLADDINTHTTTKNFGIFLQGIFYLNK